jgi:valyl-tRNA synthetase
LLPLSEKKFPVRKCKMTEKRQTSQGYIIRILQHFATKLWNITNFVMLFQAVMKSLPRLV